MRVITELKGGKFLMSLHRIFGRKSSVVMSAAALVLLLLAAPCARAQIAVGEINGSFPSSGTTKKFHGYVVFLELPSQRFTPLVINPVGTCTTKYNAPLVNTYQWAEQVGAFLALNGSFTDPTSEYKPGDCRLVFGPVKSNSVTVAPSIPRPDGKGNPALLFAADGSASIKMATGADVNTAYNVVSGQWEGGPQEGSNGTLLIESGTVMGAGALPVPSEVAPRTAVGLTQSGTLILLVVEGRLPDSDGITLPYLAQLLQGLGAYDAVNFDGGGSSAITYMPDPRVPMKESLALYNLMRASQSGNPPCPASQNDSQFCFGFTQRDPRVPFASRPSELIPPSNPNAQNLVYRPVTIHFGFAVKPIPRK
jgi:Phosphodiester glycosidase